MVPMDEINIPKKKFAGERKTVTWRMPIALLDQLELIGERKGYKISDLIIMVLDIYCQQEADRRRK